MSSLSLTLHLISHKYHLLWLVSLVNYWLSNSYWLLDYFLVYSLLFRNLFTLLFFINLLILIFIKISHQIFIL